MAKITAVTPTICQLMQITPPQTRAAALPQVLGQAKNIFNGQAVQKCLIYAPDALGLFLLQDFYNEFNQVKKVAPVTADLESVMPTVTPVCFASMFSGALPEITGIKKYEKLVVKIETVFDVLHHAGKKVALVAVKDSSIDLIFREREIEYYSEPDDAAVAARTIALMEQKDIDFILAYNQEYDDYVHRTEPFSSECIQAMYKHIKTFLDLTEAFHQAWGEYNRAIAFTPDHGAHYDHERKKGMHGTDLPADLNVRHYWGLYQSENK